jgi:acyl-CoA oxidase
MAKLCQQVGLQATTIVEAFGIPDHLVAAPIAGDWIKYNEVDNMCAVLPPVYYDRVVCMYTR